MLATLDPCLDMAGNQYFRLRRFIAAWKKEYNLPSQVKPVRIIILICDAELCGDCNRDRDVIECICTAFYFILRPWEYTNTTGNANHPFRITYVKLKIDGLHIFDSHLVTLVHLASANFVSLTFNEKKLCERRESLSYVQRPTICLPILRHDTPRLTPPSTQRSFHHSTPHIFWWARLEALGEVIDDHQTPSNGRSHHPLVCQG